MKLLIKLFSQVLLILGPVLTMNWSFLNWLGYKGGPQDSVAVNLKLFALSGPKQEVEFKIRLLVSLIAVLLVMGYEVWENYFPKRDYREFRQLYLDEKKKEWRAKLTNDVRINIMHVRRLWYFPLIKYFHWTWNDGFAPPQQHDANVTLTIWQGVCGKAYRAREPQIVDLRQLPYEKLSFSEKFFLRNQFHLFSWQLKKTSRVKCVLSIPIYKTTKDTSPEWKIVGVINLDSLTDEGADYLLANTGSLSNYYTDFGKIIACLR